MNKNIQFQVQKLRENSITTSPGATFTSGNGEQYTGPKKKVKDKETKLAAGKSNFPLEGWKVVSRKKATKESKGIDYKNLWNEKLEESLNENYSRFKNEVKTRGNSEQYHQAIKSAHKKLDEVNKILEYVSQMKNDLSESETDFKISKNTKLSEQKAFNKVVEIYKKVKKIKG